MMEPIQNGQTQPDSEQLARLQEAESQVKEKSHTLRKKSLLFFVSSMVLLLILLMAAIAWYTRVANTFAVGFNVADYDLAVSENIDKEYELNIFDYSNVTNQKMAPGTVGWIPLKLSAYRSDVDVTYTVALESKMPADDKKNMNVLKHMRFYYLKKDGKTYYGDRVIPEPGTNNTVKFEGYTKEYLNDVTRNEKEVNNGLTTISDTITKGEEPKTLCIYWEWYYDAKAANEDGQSGVSTSDEDIKAWDDLDTDIGRYPDKYKDAFTIYVYTSGVEAVPNLSKKQSDNPETSTGADTTN